jgi:hypothetical protein
MAQTTEIVQTRHTTPGEASNAWGGVSTRGKLVSIEEMLMPYGRHKAAAAVPETVAIVEQVSRARRRGLHAADTCHELEVELQGYSTSPRHRAAELVLV